MIGTILDGKYEIQQLLGQGGMGAVYAARHLGTDRRLAVKVIQHADVSKQGSLVIRLQREARAAGSIDSPHIGQVIDAGTDAASSTPYLVMELLEGEDLQQLLHRTGPLRPDVALRVVAQAALGLAKAHEARVVHRDIKPANLFLAQQPGGEVIVKVLDFGIAKLKQDELGAMESGSLTRTGSVLGSPLYMSPEQARGTKGIDHRADVWSLGVVAYQTLTGRTPYQEIDALGELILAICSELPPCVQDFAPWVDPKVAETVHRAMSLDTSERFQTADEMHAALIAHLPKRADGTPDLRLDASLFVAVEADARSISQPRLIAEMGRRPAHTGRPVSRHVVQIHVGTPAPDAGESGDRPSSPQEIEAGPTLMIEPGARSVSAASVSAVSASAVSARAPSSGATSAGGQSAGVQGGARTAARSGLPVEGISQGTEAGLSRSSPADPPRRRGALAAGAAVAAIVVGVGVAFLVHGALASAPAGPVAAAPSTPRAPAEAEAAQPSRSVEQRAPGGEALPPATVSPSPSPPSSAVAAPPVASSVAPAVPSAPRAPPGSRPVASPTLPNRPPQPPPSSKPLDNSGFGDRK